MCGIAGIWRFDKKTELEEIKTFTDSMAHRGPDGSGYKLFETSNLALGHRRLSVLDLSTEANQPMSYNNDEYWIVYNGEVYNFIEIKHELIALGLHFKTNSDTEVILAAYKTWGKACMHKFNGMFAFAIYHTPTHNLFIARDRFGVKPFHYSFIPNTLFAFASETIAFKHLHDFNREINHTHFTSTILNPNSLEHTGNTLFNNIYQLKAGHCATVTSNGIKTEKWYELTQNLALTTETYEQQVEHFKHLFFEACKLRLRSDVSLASALSGGMDSSSVFCTIQHLAENHFSDTRLPANWQQAVSISFPDTELDEAKYVKLIQQKTNADIKIIETNTHALASDIIASTKLFDNIAYTPLTPLTEVYQAMRNNGITVSLDGHAGDELLFGYRSVVYDVLFEAHLNNQLNTLELAELYVLMTKEETSIKEIQELNTKVSAIAQTFKPSLKNTLKKLIRSKHNQSNFAIPGFIKGHANKKLYQQFQYTELPMHLMHFDRAAMQCGIEIRMPMMDYRLVEYAWSLPLTSKIGNGFTKRILRDAMKGIVPREILERKTKIGLNAPTAQWLNNELSEFVLDTVRTKSFIDSPYWDGKKLSETYTQLTQTKTWNHTNAGNAWCVLNACIIGEES